MQELLSFRDTQHSGKKPAAVAVERMAETGAFAKRKIRGNLRKRPADTSVEELEGESLHRQGSGTMNRQIRIAAPHNASASASPIRIHMLMVFTSICR